MDCEQLYGFIKTGRWDKINASGALEEKLKGRPFFPEDDLRSESVRFPLSAKFNFETKEEYLAILSAEACVIAELAILGQHHDFRCIADVHLAIFGHHQKLHAVLSKLPPRTFDAVTPGDKALLRYKCPKKNKFEVAVWELRFIEPHPSSGKVTLLGSLERRYGSTEGGQQDGTQDRFILSCPKNVYVEVEMVPRHSEFVYIVAAQKVLLESPQSGI